MKIKGILLATFSLIGISGALAQVEYDDMYFSKEDRAKLEAQRATAVAYNTPEKRNKFDEDMSEINPTDSYSARNVNPEYTSRAHTQTAQSDEEDYFVNNYQYNKNQLETWNNSFNNWYSNPWYSNNYYGPAIGSWYTPYYGYSRWNSPWYDPYWNYNGWSSSFSFHYGNSWNYGWGGNYDYWNRPCHAWNPYYGGMAYFGGGYWNNYRYPGTVIVVTDDASRNRTYSKRPSRSTAIVADRNNARSRSSYASPTYSRSNSSGRTTPSARQEDYYNRYNRATQSNSNGRSSYGNSETTQFNRSRSWGNDNSTYSTPSGRTSSSPSYSTPSRSTYSGGTGSGTNGRTRGSN